MDSFKRILLANKAWAAEQLSLKPDFLSNLKDCQPEFLWIGCAESPVPPDDITGTGCGEMIVHRNLANLVVHTDHNVQSVLEFSVNTLQVNHIIVCGHYGCRAVKAALSNDSHGKLDTWLHHIKDIYRLHRTELDMYDTEERRLDRLVEVNVLEQVQHLARSSVIQKAWANGHEVKLHGWVYGLKDGRLNDLVKVGSDCHIDDVYRYALD